MENGLIKITYGNWLKPNGDFVKSSKRVDLRQLCTNFERLTQISAFGMETNP